ncbi:unnamed protein product [Ambrosiozyma monospora]|uniref:Unnamed protein product n=1 Tax=Ambrosiozyma monospora TaxID=43982 RepID=A0ACB5SVW9_AMBMO|nr:unnamed protein product [Ambrosiozyma monospora]
MIPIDLENYLFKNGFTDGEFSDVKIIAFGNEYKFSSDDNEDSDDKDGSKDKDEDKKDDDDDDEKKSDVYKISTDDSLINKNSFELMLQRLYGSPDEVMENLIPVNMLATGIFFGIDEVMAPAVTFFETNINVDYATSSLKLFEGRDYDKKEDVKRISKALNENVIYSTMDLNEIEKLSNWVHGDQTPYIAPTTLLEAAWESSQVQSIVMESSGELLTRKRITIPGRQD